MRQIFAALLALSSLTLAPAAFAGHDCSCKKECAAKCETGKSKDCACKTCGKTHKCGHEKTHVEGDATHGEEAHKH